MPSITLVTPDPVLLVTEFYILVVAYTTIIGDLDMMKALCDNTSSIAPFVSAHLSTMERYTIFDCSLGIVSVPLYFAVV